MIEQTPMEQVFDAIREERRRQDEKWGADRDQNDMIWLTILIEEVGEVAQSILQKDWIGATMELVQCAAVLVAWMENVKRRSS